MTCSRRRFVRWTSSRSAAPTKRSQATLEIDGVLTPWQRGRYRMFEELVERRKIEMLRSIGAGRGGTAPGK